MRPDGVISVAGLVMRIVMQPKTEIQMPTSNTLDDFHKMHPWPDFAGFASLFRFSKIANDNIGYLNHLFIEKKLFHSTPLNFNDPFECKPHFIWPKTQSKSENIIQHLIKAAQNSGLKQKDAKLLVAKSMSQPGLIEKTIYDIAQNCFSEMRICSFTTDKNNLLFWSHYADSHRGFCIEFDATKFPISYAYKVQYTDQYPEIIYPTPLDARALRPALIKSKHWEYENEFRTIFQPELREPKNDGESLILNGNEIKNVYLGACISDKNRDLLLEIISKGSFKPQIWSAKLAKTSFSLDFIEYVR